MYHLVYHTLDDVKIISSFCNKHDKINEICKYLEENNICGIVDVQDIRKDGLYCVNVAECMFAIKHITIIRTGYWYYRDYDMTTLFYLNILDDGIH